MIYRVYPEKDTFITNVQKNSTQQTGSNFGASEILDLFKKSASSGSTGIHATASLSRILIKFDLSEFASLTASGRAPSTGSTYHLRLTNARHRYTIPTSFSATIAPISRTWTEGNGIDNDTYLDKGYANWDKPTSTTFWTTPGGDIEATPQVSYDFDTGLEDVTANVTSLVNAWLTGGLANHGLMLKLPTALEANTEFNDYYIKKFHGKSTNFKDYRPSLEMRFDDALLDDRDNFVFGATNKLFLYNKVKGTYQDISGIGTGQNVLHVRLWDASGTIANASASHTGRTGIYSASFTLSSGSYSGSIFYDGWSKSGVTYMTCSFIPKTEGAYCSSETQRYVASVRNFKKEYENTELVRFKLFTKVNTYNPAVVNTGSLSIDSVVVTKAYYRVDNALTGKVVIPLGTGSVETTRLSYDGTGNYFDFYMQTLSPGEVYKFVFFFDVDGELQKIDTDLKFRVI